jgi:Zn-dependent protease
VQRVSGRISPWFLALVAVTVVGGVLCAVGRSTVTLTVGVVLLVLGGWVVSLCLHEFGHAVTAYRSGDRSVRERGYLTLDVRRYADLGLTLVLPVVFLLIGGIPLPGGAVWIQHGAIRSPLARSLVSFAGPAVNLVLGALATAAVALVPMPLGLAAGLSTLALIQILAFVLNILPVPGLDGFGVIEPFLSDGARTLAARVRPWAPIALFALIIGVPGVAGALWGLGERLFTVLGGEPVLAAQGYGLLFFWHR